jgi:hypothetical protein
MSEGLRRAQDIGSRLLERRRELFPLRFLRFGLQRLALRVLRMAPYLENRAYPSDAPFIVGKNHVEKEYHAPPATAGDICALLRESPAPRSRRLEPDHTGGERAPQYALQRERHAVAHRLENFQCIQYSGSHTIEPRKHLSLSETYALKY